MLPLLRRDLVSDRMNAWFFSRVVVLLRLAGVVSIISGLIGGCVWLVDLADRSDGDDLRWGFWHNPFMQFPPFDETFLDISMWVLFVCSAVVGLSGLMLLGPLRWGAALVAWQARVAVTINGVIAILIGATMIALAKNGGREWDIGGTAEALVLRLGSVAVDLILWAFLSSDAVREFFVRRSHPPGRAFDVVMKDGAAQPAEAVE